MEIIASFGIEKCHVEKDKKFAKPVFQRAKEGEEFDKSWECCR